MGLLAAVEEAWADLEARTVRDLDAEERALLVRLLVRLLERVRTSMVGDAA